MENPQRFLMFYLVASLLCSGCVSQNPQRSVASAPPEHLAKAKKGGGFTANVMAPLMVGDLNDPNGAHSKPAWEAFASELKLMKDLGFGASTSAALELRTPMI